jgi:hypothetical protein
VVALRVFIFLSHMLVLQAPTQKVGSTVASGFIHHLSAAVELITAATVADVRCYLPHHEHK